MALVPENPRLILASGSPRRRELLRKIGINFEVIPANVDESIDETLPSAEAVRVVAHRKAAAVAEQYRSHVVLGADTSVVIQTAGREHVLGKPKDKDDAAGMLRELSGRQHAVHTGYALICGSTGLSIDKVVSTEVQFADLSEEMIEGYLSIGEHRDKAGGYAIQGAAACFIRSIKGSYTNVVGLPLAEIVQTFVELGMWEPSQLTHE